VNINLNQTIIESLEKIYSSIQNFPCKHCHKCCGPIIWFEPEEILIRDYLEKNKIKRIVWTKEEFEKNQMRCLYLINYKCIIYSVRPIVCRLQGNIFELKCKSSNASTLISENELNDIRKEFVRLIRRTNKMNIFYSTLKLKPECIS
jgi:Fe-S-cluster containining protein